MLTTALTGLGAVVLMMTALWLVSLVVRDVSLIDVFWGPGFVLLAWLYFALGPAQGPRTHLVPILVTLWGGRLAAHLLIRNWGKGEDYRYREMRQRYGARFSWLSLFIVFWLQAVLLWIVALPTLQVQRDTGGGPLGWLDAFGLACFAVGLFFEVVGDWQLARFRSDASNRGRVLDSGLWRYTRHPNYFGDAMVWWGVFCIAAATPGSLWTLISPLVMTGLLMRVSGVTLLERKLKESRPAYSEYVARTNAFFPWFPRSG